MINKVINYIKDSKFKIYYCNNNVNIINYDNILEVNDKVVTIMKDKKIVTIKGNDLKLNKLLDNEVLISGIINKIEL